MNSLTEMFDDLNLSHEKGFMSKLEPDERIIMSCTLFKFNDYKKR